MSPSTLHVPRRNTLRPLHDSAAAHLNEVAQRTQTEIEGLLTQKNYPCLAALRSYHRDEYQVGFYEDFGSGKSWRSLREDLLYFLTQQRESNSSYLTFWATYSGPSDLTEMEFEDRLWRELSSLTSEEERHEDWGSAVTDPSDPAFCFHLFGEAFFVVGLHKNSSRLSRRFSQPTLIFNVFSQFQQLNRQGHYWPMVQANRERDTKFQGSVNPMALLYGEKWETIQFSGRENSQEWKCPFQFLKKWMKA